eukprot:1160479-Pelagomonas_calceolata.AAC.2
MHHCPSTHHVSQLWDKLCRGLHCGAIRAGQGKLCEVYVCPWKQLFGVEVIVDGCQRREACKWGQQVVRCGLVNALNLQEEQTCRIAIDSCLRCGACKKETVLTTYAHLDKTDIWMPMQERAGNLGTRQDELREVHACPCEHLFRTSKYPQLHYVIIIIIIMEGLSLPPSLMAQCVTVDNTVGAAVGSIMDVAVEGITVEDCQG